MTTPTHLAADLQSVSTAINNITVTENGTTTTVPGFLDGAIARAEIINGISTPPSNTSLANISIFSGDETPLGQMRSGFLPVLVQQTLQHWARSTQDAAILHARLGLN